MVNFRATAVSGVVESRVHFGIKREAFFLLTPGQSQRRDEAIRGGTDILVCLFFRPDIPVRTFSSVGMGGQECPPMTDKNVRPTTIRSGRKAPYTLPRRGEKAPGDSLGP